MTRAMPGRLQDDGERVRTARRSACEGLRVIEAAASKHLSRLTRSGSGRIREGTERVCRPDSVRPEGRDGHSSWPAVACRLQPSTRTLGWAPCAAEAASRAYMMLLRMGFGLPRLSPAARWALTPPFHPCPRGRGPPGGLFSVPLSVAFGGEVGRCPTFAALWRLAVSQHPAQWSPDLPPGCPGDRPTRSGHDCITFGKAAHFRTPPFRKPLITCASTSGAQDPKLSACRSAAERIPSADRPVPRTFSGFQTLLRIFR